MRPIRRPVSLTIVGSGPEEAELRALVQSSGVRGARFVGFVDQDGLPAYYAAADVFVFPTLDDPLWNSPLGSSREWPRFSRFRTRGRDPGSHQRW
jgi:glycosyltransferase involved in cell wall biosynthesis